MSGGEQFIREQQIAYLLERHDVSKEEIDELLDAKVALDDMDALLDLGELVATSSTDYLYDGRAAKEVSSNAIDCRILAGLYQISKRRASDDSGEGWEEVAEEIVEEALNEDAGEVGKRNKRWQLLEEAMSGSKVNSIDCPVPI